MLQLWGGQTRYSLWRELWLALAESQRALGINIPDAAINEMRAHQTDIDFKAVADYERRFRHDVMAHVHAFGVVAPAAAGHIHLGATSCYVTDNAELILMRRGLEILREKIVRIMTSLAEFAREYREMPALGYTHLQPAQLTTVG
ncbi:MAG: lyase family protein, partial [Gemmatimonadaceae bacterium]